MRHVAVGRADLVRLLRTLAPEAEGRAAALLGFAAAPEAPPLPRALTPPAPLKLPAPPSLPAAESQPRVAAPLCFLRPETAAFSAESLAPPPSASLVSAQPAPAAASGLTHDDLHSPGCSVFLAPPPPPLLPWPRLWPRLQHALQRSVSGQRLDLGAVLRALGRGEFLRRLPRLQHPVWATRVTLWIDRSARLVPFWADQDRVVRRLRRLLGKGGLAVQRYDDREARSTAVVDREARSAAVGDRGGGLPQGRGAVDPQRPLLVLGDLGMYGPALLRAQHRHGAAALQRQGVRIAALVPVPRRRWHGPTARLLGALPWDPGRRPAAAQGVERLLDLIALTGLAQLGLVRALRRLLPSGQADVGTEVEACLHPDVAAADATGVVLHAAAALRRRERLEALQQQGKLETELPVALQRAVVRTIQRWHADLPRELAHTEALLQAVLLPAAVAADGLPPEALAAARAFAGRLAQTAIAGPLTAQAAVTRYGRVALAAMPEVVYREVKDLALVWARASRDAPVQSPVPKGINPIAAYAVLEAPGEDQTYEITQVGETLVIAAAAGATRVVKGRPENTPGSLLGWLVAARPRVFIGRGGTELAYPLPAIVPLRPREDLVLRTDRGQLALRAWQSQPWFCAAGRDRYGLWAQAQVKDVPFRLRWIPPGRFLMGSPQTEAGQSEDEGPRHPVELTRGYWLGETLVTQALWRKVKGYNPSRFPGEDRPVEQVSWDECQDFLKRLEWALPGLSPRLPTEAEWERACRGGVEAATYRGDLVIEGQNSAPVLDAIAWYAGNSGVDFELADGDDSSEWLQKQYEHKRAGTHPVGRKAANPLGLYDVLGNVLEWCQDFYGFYPDGPARNPVGPQAGSSRVVRGGSWNDDARRMRTAHRDWYGPGTRRANLGFRLAGGQGSAPRSDGAAGPQSGVAVHT